MTPLRLWSLFLAITSLLLVAIIAWELTTPYGPQEIAAAPLEYPAEKSKKTAFKQTSPPFRLEKVAAYAAIAERPLFSPSRQPTKPPPPIPKTAGRKSITNISLSGIIISPDQKTALIRSSKSPKLQSLIEGEKIQGWRLVRVLADRIVLTAGDETAEISIWDKSKSRGSRASTAPVRQPKRHPPRK